MSVAIPVSAGRMSDPAASPSPPIGELFLQVVAERLDLVRRTLPMVTNVAEAIAAAHHPDTLIHAWGTGHSAMFVKELFYRSGGLVQINPLYDPALIGIPGRALSISDYDNRIGYSPQILDLHSLRVGEFLLIFATLGVNVSAVDLCLAAQHRGLRTVAVTSVDYACSLPARHPGGNRLHEIADYVIDNPVEPGDAVLGSGEVHFGATGTITGMILCQLLVVEIIAAVRRLGKPVEVIQSAASAQAAAANLAGLSRFTTRIPHL